jgi:hypothetical protein
MPMAAWTSSSNRCVCELENALAVGCELEELQAVSTAATTISTQAMIRDVFCGRRIPQPPGV